MIYSLILKVLFGDFLRHIVKRSRYDQHIRGYFDHSRCYIYEADL